MFGIGTLTDETLLRLQEGRQRGPLLLVHKAQHCL
jgi:hypothetical protein